MVTIAIDFDGVIHKYSKGWHDGTIYDEPIDGAIEFINKLLGNNFNVFIFSTRSPRQIKKWLLDNSNMLLYMSQSDFFDRFFPFQDEDKQLIVDEYNASLKLQYRVKTIPFWTKFWDKKRILGITRRKLPAYIYIDDRAFKFNNNFKEIMLLLESNYGT